MANDATSGSVIILDMNGLTTDSEYQQNALLFATTVASKLAMTKRVLFIDAKPGYPALRAMDADEDAFTLKWWQEDKENWDCFPSSNVQIGTGKDVECLALSYVTSGNGSANRKNSKTPTGSELSQLMFHVKEQYDFIVVMGNAQTETFRYILPFGDFFFHLADPFSTSSYANSLLYTLKNRYGKSDNLVHTVFVGCEPTVGHWKVSSNFQNQERVWTWREPLDRKVEPIIVCSPAWSDPKIERVVQKILRGESTLLLRRNSLIESSRPVEKYKNEKGAVERTAHLEAVKSVKRNSVTSGLLGTVFAGTFLFPALYGAWVDPLQIGAAASLRTLSLGLLGWNWRVSKKTASSVQTEKSAVSTVADVESKEDSSHDVLWDKLEKQRKAIMNSWLEYELDPNLALRYPTMLDSSVPTTAALHTAMARVDLLSAQKSKDVSPVDTPYWDAVQSMDLAFKVALEHARKIGRSVWTIEQRPKVELAEKLLAKALDEGSTIPERQTAYERAVRELEGITALPQKADERVRASIALIEA